MLTAMRGVLMTLMMGCALAASVEKRSDRHTPAPTEGISDFEDGERVKRAIKLWEGGQVCYVFNGNFDDEQMKRSVDLAVKAFTDVSCVDFTDITNCQTDGASAVAQNDQAGCWADIGCMASGRINLADECDMYGPGVVMHELFHLLGRQHEHTRPDRDAFVKIKTENIKPGKEHNFEMSTHKDYGIPYDYESIMHYGITFFSTEGKPTIELVNKKYIGKVGKQLKLTPYDVMTVNKMYDCYTKAGITDPKGNCQNGGVLTNDNICYCVEPFTGDDCLGYDESKVDKYVKISTAGESMEVETPNYPKDYAINTRFNVLLKCEDTTKKVDVYFDDFDLEAWGCGYDKVKITISGADLYPTSYCDDMLDAKRLTSEDSNLFIQFLSDDAYTYPGFKGTFTCV